LIQYDSDWGKVKLETTEIGHSSVIDTGNTKSKTVTITTDKYGVGIGTGGIYYRGQAAEFAQGAVLPAWQEYSVPFTVIWRWMQVKLIGPAG